MTSPSATAARVRAASPDERASAGDRLQRMATFVRIVEAGSLSAAAAQLGTTQPTVSRRLQALEHDLGVRLLQRTTHTMRLTVDGERCYRRAKELLAGWDAFEAELRGARQEPEGHLRVAMPHAFGQDRLVAPLAEFMQAHPRVTVEWLLIDELRDFVGRGIDCAIQVGEPTDPSVVAIRIGEVPRIVVGSPVLLEGRAPPDHPQALATLPWLALQTFYRREVTLTRRADGQSHRIAIQPRLMTDSLYALRSAALRGLGACVGSAWLLRPDIERGDLVHLAPGWEASALPVYLAYPSAPHYPSRLTAFIDAMRSAAPPSIAAS